MRGKNTRVHVTHVTDIAASPPRGDTNKTKTFKNTSTADMSQKRRDPGNKEKHMCIAAVERSRSMPETMVNALL